MSADRCCSSLCSGILVCCVCVSRREGGVGCVCGRRGGGGRCQHHAVTKLSFSSSSPFPSHSLTIFQCGHLHPPVQDANLGPRRVKQLKEFTDYQILLLQFVLAQVLTRQGGEKGGEGEERGRRRERERKREGGREGRQEQREKG